MSLSRTMTVPGLLCLMLPASALATATIGDTTNVVLGFSSDGKTVVVERSTTDHECQIDMLRMYSALTGRLANTVVTYRSETCDGKPLGTAAGKKRRARTLLGLQLQPGTKLEGRRHLRPRRQEYHELSGPQFTIGLRETGRYPTIPDDVDWDRLPLSKVRRRIVIRRAAGETTIWQHSQQERPIGTCNDGSCWDWRRKSLRAGWLSPNHAVLAIVLNTGDDRADDNTDTEVLVIPLRGVH